MSEYIERSSVLAKAQWEEFYDADADKDVAYQYVTVEDVESVPTADVVEVKHGRWELNGNDDDCGCSYFCDRCGANYDEDWFYEHGQFVQFNYCPNCGAKMDGE